MTTVSPLLSPRIWYFNGGSQGAFRIATQRVLRGEALPAVSQLEVTQTAPATEELSGFCLRGVVSNERYVTKPEKGQLLQRQEPMGREVATLGALIPIKKNAAWWALSQDERRAIFEDRSKHIAIGLKALPQVARRLHHCRDLATSEPFDFLTWFDFQPSAAATFDDLLGALRQTEEWQYVDREVELRVEH